jgi:beta-N-acetylhexosaminidase
VHSGSYGNILVIAENFPGISSPDRPLDEDIPIIRKTYEELTETNFVPFSELTDLTKDSYSIVDGLLVSHAKYEALQGTIRPSTRPLSFDETSLQSLIQLPEFNEWWLEGGLLVSDNLSTNAIQRFYIAQEEEFDVRLVALNAFLAGNDILNLGDYKFDDLTSGDGYQNITDTINLFIQKYQEDELFSQKVDNAVLRILKAKYNLFPSFEFISTISESIDPEFIGLFHNNSLTTALGSATLISPSIDDLIISMPEAPLQSDKILIITDTDTTKQCSECPEIDVLSVNSFQQAALKLYGPDAGSRVLEQNMVSYSMQDLTEFLSEEENPELNIQFESDILSSEWIILLLQEINAEDPDSLSILQLINQRLDLIQQKKIVVFSLNAPYYLDTTITSNVSVIYGLYSKQPQFIDVAVRLLFKELSAPGASPVSIQSTGYDLATALTPATDQIVDLSVEIADQQNNTEEDNQAEFTEFEYEIGDTIHIQSSIILDQNGNPVPDNTLAKYTMTVINNNEIVSERVISSQTNDGVASATVTLDNAGALTINATIGDSLESTELKLEIIDVNNIPVETEVVPDPTEEPDQPQPIPDYDIVTALKTGDVTMSLWLLLVLVNTFVSVFAYQVAINSGLVRWGIRHAFTTFIGGILAIIFLSSGIDLVRSMLKVLSLWEVAVITMIGSLIGWLSGVIWRFLSLKKQ